MRQNDTRGHIVLFQRFASSLSIALIIIFFCFCNKKDHITNGIKQLQCDLCFSLTHKKDHIMWPQAAL